MAIIKNMKRVDKPDKISEQTTSKAEYFIRDDGFQINTFGSDSRQEVGKSSQIIYFTGDALQQIKGILKEIEGLKEARILDKLDKKLDKLDKIK